MKVFGGFLIFLCILTAPIAPPLAAILAFLGYALISAADVKPKDELKVDEGGNDD